MQQIFRFHKNGSCIAVLWYKKHYNTHDSWFTELNLYDSLCAHLLTEPDSASSASPSVPVQKPNPAFQNKSKPVKKPIKLLNRF